MSFRDDERGQAIQVGAVLLFAAMIIAFSTYQAFVVPSQNKEVEFKHSQQVQGELLDVRNTIVSVPGGNTGRSISVTLGTQYPSRLIALNPGPATGTLRTVGTTMDRYNLTIRNASATGETGDFWNGGNHTYGTGGLVYEPNYNRYNAPETVYENSVLYNDGGDQMVPLTGQQLIEGNRITLVTLNGSLSSTRSGTTSVDLRSLSTSTQTVSVSNESHNLTISVPTQLSAAEWRNLTEGEEHVVEVNVSEDALDGDWGLLELDLENETTYDLRMAKVGIGTGATETNGSYMVGIEGDGSTVAGGETKTLVIEVRDAFNNPVSGATVYAEGDSGSLDRSTITTTDDGRARFEYTAPEGGGEDSIDFSTAYNLSASPVAPVDDAENVTMDVSIRTDASGSDSAYDTYWLDTSDAGVSCDAVTQPERCTLNAGQASQMDLVAATNPSTENAGLDYSVNDTSIGGLDFYSGNTSGGQDTRTFTPSANGTVSLFAASGGSGDQLIIEVIDFGTGTGSSPPVIGSLSVTDRSNPGQGPRFDVSWTVSDSDGDLSQVTIELYGPFSFLRDRETVGVSGSSASQTTGMSHSNSFYCGSEYEIQFEVTDGDRSATATRTLTANC